jgi:hypothetical protein
MPDALLEDVLLLVTLVAVAVALPYVEMVSGCLSVFCPSACLREFGSQGKNFSEI